MAERVYDQREDNLRAMHERGERSVMERGDPGDDVLPPRSRADGWPPVVPVPLSIEHARAMIEAGERYLRESGR